MKKLFRCALCGEVICKKKELFILKENIENWDSSSHATKIIKFNQTVCAECLIEYVEDTERIPKTLPQIEYRYVNINDC